MFFAMTDLDEFEVCLDNEAEGGAVLGVEDEGLEQASDSEQVDVEQQVVAVLQLAVRELGAALEQGG